MDRGKREREKNRTLHPSHQHRITEEVYLERQMKEGEEDCCENFMEEKRRRVMPMYCQIGSVNFCLNGEFTQE